jgi:hypothetical protein
MFIINSALVGKRILMLLKMHGTTLKITDAQRAKLGNSHKNTKLKLLKTNAAIWFNKICRIKRLKPNYINIKTKGKKQQDKMAIIKATRYRINQ